MKNYSDELLDFLTSNPTAFNCISSLKELLVRNNFLEVSDIYEKTGKYVLTRNNAGIIAVNIPEKIDRISMVASHSDSPCLHIKNNAEIYDHDYLKLNVEPYGGMTKFTWFDRPLSIAGRVIYKDGSKYQTEIINIDEDLMVIPSLCAHQSDYAKDGFNPNPQKEMLPLLAISSEKKTFIEYLSDYLNKEIIDYDLYVYVHEKAKYVGLNKEFILSPRIDNQACAFGTLMGYLEGLNDNNTLKVYCCFNSEEIGSLTIDGADSTFLNDVLVKICAIKGLNLQELLNKSLLISADNGHAIHPNYPEKNDPTNICYLNKGIMIKHHVNYTTNGLSSAILKDILKKSNLPCQDFAARSDTRNGSTLGKISQNHVSVLSVDIGLAQLSMHSANETCGSKDINYLVESIKEFFLSEYEY